MAEETLKFVVNLGAEYWEHKPQFSIWVDDHVVIQTEFNTAPHIVKFERTFDEGDHTLKIRLENKTAQDTLIENSEIVKDMLLNIDDITIDDISLGNLLWTAEYILDHPQEYKGNTINHLDGCVNLGWNGTYVLKFTTPFYVWLLEKL